jgi:dTDP-4-dehydrorhamnose reductase
MKLCVVGAKGMLGQAFVRMSQQAGHAVVALDLPDIDITSPESLDTVLGAHRPEGIINCAAYTAVDAAETDEERALLLNATAVGYIADAARKLGAFVMHISTDYVFDGVSEKPYIESDMPCPASAYGRTKYAGETVLMQKLSEHYIIRIAWLYGPEGATNFVKTIRRIAEQRAKEQGVLRVVNDQFGSPTCTDDVCRQALALMATQAYGLYHGTSQGYCSWHDFACRIVQNSGLATVVETCTTQEFPRPAPRPAFAVLENCALKKLGLDLMPHWQEAFDVFCLKERLAL